MAIVKGIVTIQLMPKYWGLWKLRASCWVGEVNFWLRSGIWLKSQPEFKAKLAWARTATIEELDTEIARMRARR